MGIERMIDDLEWNGQLGFGVSLTFSRSQLNLLVAEWGIRYHRTRQ